jgi:hypothetical protein
MPLGSVVIRVGLRVSLSGRGGGRSRPGRGRRSEESAAAPESCRAAASTPLLSRSCNASKCGGNQLEGGGGRRGQLPRVLYLVEETRGGAQHRGEVGRKAGAATRGAAAVFGFDERAGRERKGVLGRRVLAFLFGPEHVLGAHNFCIPTKKNGALFSLSKHKAKELQLSSRSVRPLLSVMEASLFVAPVSVLFSIRGKSRRCFVATARSRSFSLELTAI